MKLYTIPPAPHESVIVTLTGTLRPDSTSVPVSNAGDLWPAPNIATIFDRSLGKAETIYYEGKTANTLTGVIRGYEGRTGIYEWVPYDNAQGQPMVQVTNALTSSFQDRVRKNMALVEDAINELGTGAGTVQSIPINTIQDIVSNLLN